MRLWTRWLHKNFNLKGEISPSPSVFNYLKAFFVAGIASAIVFMLEHLTYEQFSNITSLFVVSVLYSSIYYGMGPTILNALLCTSVYEYFFIPPFFSIGPHGMDNFIKFSAFVMAGLITHLLSVKIRKYALDLREREKRVTMLHELSECIADVSSLTGVVDVVEAKVKTLLGVSATIYLTEEWNTMCHVAKKPAKHRALLVPLKTGRGVIGVMHISDKPRHAHKKNFQEFMEILAAQIALSIERIFLHNENERVRFEKEREALRAALLSSVSHDLKTPLVSIMGAASMLRISGNQLAYNDRDILLATIEDEASRLNRFISNLLEITKLESGAAILNCEPVNLDDMIDIVLKRMQVQLKPYRMRIELPFESPFILLDMTFMEHVFMNLLENAVKYSQEGTNIVIRNYENDAHVIIEIEDEGCGVPESELEKVFDKFYRVQRTDSQVAGTGLGLSICQSIISAHGGTIKLIIPEKNQGTLVRIAFPLTRAVPVPLFQRQEEVA